mmetsp:Transcript_6725/g.11975  ORF Transcript_6725/g.11975 Transcript_6725/m.11975 type:complete len:306 (-) Transcript_6725:2110-3027(-)
MAQQDSTYVEVKVGEEPEAPGLQVKVELVLGGGSFDSEVSEISSRIGGLESLKVYVVFQAISADSAQELATFLTSEWAKLSSGQVTESALAALIPALKPDPEAPGLVDLSFTAHNDLVVVSGAPNEELSFQAAAMVEMGAEQAAPLLENKQGVKLEVDFGASFADVIHSDNPILDLFKSFKARFDVFLDTASFGHAEQIVAALGVPPQVTQGLKLAALYKSAHLALAFRSPSELPSGIRDQIQSTGEFAKQAFAAAQMIPPADRTVLEKLAEHTTGSVDVYANASKALLKIHVVAKGASDLLKGN